MTILDTLSHIAADYRARRRQFHTYMQVSALPREIQKDIGWPDTLTEERRARHYLINVGR